MKRSIYMLLATASTVLALITITSAARAQVSQEDVLNAATTELRNREVEFDQKKTNYALSEGRYKAGHTAAAEVNSAKAELEVATNNLTRSRQILDREQRIATFYRPMTIVMKDATVQEAAKALSQASGMPINVDKQVPKDIRLSVEAQGVPFATVLESIAEQAKLMVAPDGSGVALKTWPTLKVNGNIKEFTGPNAPIRAQVSREDVLNAVMADLHNREVEYDQKKTNYPLLEERYKAGHTAAAEVNSAKAELDVAANNLQRTQQILNREQRIATFYRPMNINMKDATVLEAANALSQASGMPINVDKQVPKDIRLSVEAQGVPFATILESVAEQAKLMIAPDGNGVVLKTWPTLKLDGAVKEFTGPNAPWSTEWGSAVPLVNNNATAKWMYLSNIVGGPTDRFWGDLEGGLGNSGAGPNYPPWRAQGGTGSSSTGFGRGVPGGGSGGSGGLSTGRGSNAVGGGGGRSTGLQTGTTVKGAGGRTGNNALGIQGSFGSGAVSSEIRPGPAGNGRGFGFTGGTGGGGFGGMTGVQSGGFGDNGGGGFGFIGAPLSLSTMGDHLVVVAEPGPGPKGEAGAWLTVYKWDGARLSKVSTTFHLSALDGRQGQTQVQGRRSSGAKR
jgi:hypothetical protein